MLDDVGFAQLGAYGGLIDTPNLDALAKNGLKYSNYHTTPICSASRAALLTGRNPHTVHVGSHAAAAMDFPGYDARIPAEAGTLAENLRQTGYVTFALGKWDHLPSADVNPSGPFTYWPSGQGFDKFYGFLSADTNNFHPTLWADHTAVEPQRDPQYHLDVDLADHAITWIDSRDAQADRAPFFIYYATGTAHAPHHAPKAYLDRYKGRFDNGWDAAAALVLEQQIRRGIVPAGTKLPPRAPTMPAWNTLTPLQKKVYARQMEAFAAALTHADAQFGRILQRLRERGELDNTIVVVTSDNGASAEGAEHGTFNEHLFTNGRYPTAEENSKHLDGWGTAQTFPHYALGWAIAGNTPFRYYKQTTWEGGVRVPLIVSWPKSLAARNETRPQFVHVSDLTPTLLAAAGVEPAVKVNNLQQSGFDGSSILGTFASAKAPGPKQVQYFEMFGNRAIWADGWKANVSHRTASWDLSTATPFDGDKWQLFNLNEDPTERTDLASKLPKKLAEMERLFDREARRYGVYPLMNAGDSGSHRANKARASFAARAGVWEYTGIVSRIPEASQPPILGMSYTAKAKVALDNDQANGVIFAGGGQFGGVSFYISNGRPTFSFVNPDLRAVRLQSGRALPKGIADLELNFEREPGVGAGANVQLIANGEQVAQGIVPGPLPRAFSISETFGIGADSGTPPTQDYDVAQGFPGQILKVRFDFNRTLRPGEAAVSPASPH